ncbi:MAG: hypothetical protein ACI835_003082 [Planctomycetota bacterium]|jgi:hypothetical protein
MLPRQLPSKPEDSAAGADWAVALVNKLAHAMAIRRGAGGKSFMAELA